MTTTKTVIECIDVDCIDFCVHLHTFFLIINIFWCEQNITNENFTRILKYKDRNLVWKSKKLKYFEDANLLNCIRIREVWSN